MLVYFFCATFYPPPLIIAAKWQDCGAHQTAVLKPARPKADKGRGVISDPSVHERVLDELAGIRRAQPGSLAGRGGITVARTGGQQGIFWR